MSDKIDRLLEKYDGSVISEDGDSVSYVFETEEDAAAFARRAGDVLEQNNVKNTPAKSKAYIGDAAKQNGPDAGSYEVYTPEHVAASITQAIGYTKELMKPNNAGDPGYVVQSAKNIENTLADAAKYMKSLYGK